MPNRLDSAMYIAATSPYVSGTFWTAVGSLGALLALVLTVLFRRFPVPRVILYRLPAATSLLSTDAPGMEHADIQVTSHGQPVSHPYAVSMHIEGQSRFDIRRSDFDGDIPMVFDLGATIISPLLIEGSEELKAAVELTGSEIKIKPTTIRRKQYVRVNVLTEGNPILKTRNEPIGVKLIERTIYRLRWKTLLGVFLLILAVIDFFSDTFSGVANNILGALFLGLFVGGVWFLVDAISSWPQARRDLRAGRRSETVTIRRTPSGRS